MTAVSKNIYFDVLDYIFDRYNNTVHTTIKIKPIDVRGYSYADYNEDFNKNILSLTLVTMLEFQHTKTFLLNDMLQIGQRKSLLLLKLKIQFRGLMSLLI